MKQMDLVTILFIALGLSMDAVAVSLASGCSARKLEPRRALLLAFLFGLFQTLMPVAVWLAGLGFKTVIEGYDHWLAFVLLAFIGGKMILEASRGEARRPRDERLGLPVMLGLALATSIDALAVGLSFSLLAIDIVIPVLVIGLVTFALSLLAVFAGQRFGSRLAGKAEALGGVILIAIGLRILVGHLLGAGKA